jgi:hypothetical protein
MRITPLAWSALLGAGIALYVTTPKGSSEQRIREVVDSYMQDVANTQGHALERAGDGNAHTRSVKAGEAGGEAVYVIPIDALFDRWAPAMCETCLNKAQPADPGGGKMEAVKFEFDLNEGRHIDCLFSYSMNGGASLSFITNGSPTKDSRTDGVGASIIVLRP